MEDIICLSSGSDDDSDLEVISSYNEEKEDAVPFIRAQWLPVTPVLIDITDHNFFPPRRRLSRRDTCSSLEVIDLSEDDPPDDVGVQKPSPTLPSLKSRDMHVAPASFGKPQELQSRTSVGKDVANSGSFVGSTVQSVVFKPLSQENTRTDALQRTEDYLHPDTNCNSSLPSEQLSWDKSLEHCRSNDKSKNPFKYESEVLKNTKDSQLSTPAVCSTEADQEDNLDSSQKWDDSILSPYNLDSPYYCPSEVDAYIFSDSEDNDRPYTTYDSQQPTSELPSATHTASVSNALLLKEEGEAMTICKNEVPHIQIHPKPLSPCIPTSSRASPPRSPELLSRQSKPNSPTSTEILASDTAAHSPDLSTLGSSSSPLSILISQPSSPNFPERTEQNRNYLDVGSPESPPMRLWDTSSDDDNENVPESELSENNSEDRQHICLTQYKKLSQCMSGTVPQMDDDEEDEHYGSAEPLCRQSLSLVYSTIEENYPEGTLQLLSDFIQPRYYPPVDITTHLLSGILLNPQSPDVFVVEAYNLLMKTQRYHPVDTSTVPWDWQLMKSVMEEQDDTTRLQPEVQYMFLQYALQVLEDDFHFKLSTQHLYQSVVKKILGSGKTEQFKDIIRWLMNAAKESVNHSKDVEYPKKEDNYLKIVLSLQRMLTLSLEVDKDLEYNLGKFSSELFLCLKNHSCRQTRLLLLRTLDSKLLRCELLKLLLDDCSSKKKFQTMSLNLLLHYLKSSTLASAPTDAAEKWRKWDDLLQLLWMLMLSYEEVVTGHLRRPITNRFDKRHALIWTPDDRVTRSGVQEATRAFLSRAADDIGHALPMEMQDLLSQLQEHITDMSSVISSR
ncbi:uncharacterized protein simc1 [Garra rufa]|uniref:uncharacterized protein simc1 n=1 Tax=Garra rufa TaxID=137080 RepID=UPI003CCE8F0C